jgi:hypothetical protein
MPKATRPTTTPRPPRLRPRPGLTTGNVTWLACAAVAAPEPAATAAPPSWPSTGRSKFVDEINEISRQWAARRRRRELRIVPAPDASSEGMEP